MEAQTQKNSITNRWQTIGVCIGMIIGFVYPSIGLALGMLMGIVFGKLILVKIPLNTSSTKSTTKVRDYLSFNIVHPIH